MHTAARLALVTGALTFAIWLAPASVQIIRWPQSGPVRLAYMWPLARFWIAAAITTSTIAALAALWRFRGRTVDELASALNPLTLLMLWIVPFLPALADRAPLLMILAGPLRWVIGALAIGAVIVRVFEQLRPFRLMPVPGINGIAVFAISAILYSVCGLQYANEVGFEGDEPHYLVIAHSLIADHDLDIANNHAQRDYRTFYGDDLQPDFLRRGRGGEIYSVHAPGLPALVAPAYAAAGANATVVVVAICAALAALLMYRVATMLAGPAVAILIWAATAFTVPFMPHAWLVYPEAPAALIVAFAVLQTYQAPTSRSRLITYALALSCLPWLHTKFVVLMAPLVLYEMVRMRHDPLALAAFLAPILVIDGLWLYSFYWMYGELNPQAPYASFPRVYVLWRNVPRGILGLLFDRKFGLFVYSPVYVVAPMGAWIMLRDRSTRLIGSVLVAMVVIFAVSSTRFYMWWGGSSGPARFLVPIVPLVAPMLTVAIARARQSSSNRAWATAVVAASVVFAAAAVLSPRHTFFFSHAHGSAEFADAVQGSAPLDAALPTFTEADWPAPVRTLVLWLVAAAGAFGAAAVCARATPASAFGIGMTAVTVFLATAGSLVRSFSDTDRTAAAMRGQFAMLDAYDPSRFHAVDATHTVRLTSREVLGRLATSVVRDTTAGSSEKPLEGPIELPPGQYEARLWFDGQPPPTSEAIVALGPDVIAARTPSTPHSPVPVAFDLPVRAAVLVGVGDTPSARMLRRVDVEPVDLAPKSFRSPLAARAFETADGGAGGFIAYLDDRTYREGGVFWTRGTHEGSVLVSSARATRLRLILHVGPTGGPVTIRSGDRRVDVDMKPDETREIEWPLQPGVMNVVLAIKAARSFVPAEVDKSSDDRRALGCQVRAHLE